MFLRVVILLLIFALSWLSGRVFGKSPNTIASVADISFSGLAPDPWVEPRRNPESPFPLQAKAGIVLDRHSGRVFFERNPDLVLPIASLTKIMTAVVVLDKKQGELTPRQTDLFKKMLVYSDNQATEKLVGEAGVSLMNKKAKAWGLKATNFKDVTGLNPNNVSSPRDLVELIKQSLAYRQIWETLALPEYNQIENTNKLLGKYGVIAGKTGYTDEAGQSLIILTNKLLSVVLSAEDRFEESEKLINLFSDAEKN